MRVTRLVLSITAAVAILASMATAQAQELVDELALAAAVTGGIAGGEEILIGSLGKGKVTATGDGAYDVALAKGTMKFLFTATDTCVFAVHSQMDGEGTSEVRFDLTKATGIDVQSQGEWEGLKATLVTFNGPEGIMQTLMSNEWISQPMAISFLASSMTTEEITAAAEELRRRCPGG
jgi:hypothetical protein